MMAVTTAGASRWKQVERWLGWAAWVGLGIEALLWFTLSDASIENLPLLLLTSAVLILGTWLCAVALVVRYQRLFSAWYGFAGLVVALALANWGRGSAASGGVMGLLLMGTLGLMVALPTSMVLLLRRRDVSVELVGLALLAFVWGSLLASVPHGGPIRAWLQYLTSPETGQFWWFETLTCLLMVTLPLGGLAFFMHLLRLVVKEVQGK